jgi:hypothetical protein
LKKTNIPVKIFWRKDDFANIKDLLLNIATVYHNNIENIENKHCFVLDKEPINWLLMISIKLHPISYK